MVSVGGDQPQQASVTFFRNFHSFPFAYRASGLFPSLFIDRGYLDSRAFPICRHSVGLDAVPRRQMAAIGMQTGRHASLRRAQSVAKASRRGNSHRERYSAAARPNVRQRPISTFAPHRHVICSSKRSVRRKTSPIMGGSVCSSEAAK